jgi:hypothetical protein
MLFDTVLYQLKHETGLTVGGTCRTAAAISEALAGRAKIWSPSGRGRHTAAGIFVA